ncbi:MAG: hypothetical protein AB9866_11030 [Syntrophobacteraceae bacterium]
MAKITPEQGVKKLYNLFYGERDRAERRKQKHGPVRQQALIGVASIEEIRARVAGQAASDGPARNEPQTQEGVEMAKIKKIIVCSACKEEKEHLARGMCKACYWKDPEIVERKRQHDLARFKKGRQEQPAPPAAEEVPAPTAEQVCTDLSITIDFSGCSEVLGRIRKLAQDLDRTPEGQVRFILRKAFRVRTRNIKENV